MHAYYAIFEKENPWVDRDKIEPQHFKKWVDFCKKRGLGCDFNPTFFSHPKCDPLTLSSPNEETRKFWIEHGKACIRISEYLAERIENNTLLEVLYKVKIKKGDVFFVEAGTIHAIGKGTFICEVQQNSNKTYRVYDYDRRDKNGNAR